MVVEEWLAEDSHQIPTENRLEYRHNQIDGTR